MLKAHGWTCTEMNRFNPIGLVAKTPFFECKVMKNKISRHRISHFIFAAMNRDGEQSVNVSCLRCFLTLIPEKAVFPLNFMELLGSLHLPPDKQVSGV